MAYIIPTGVYLGEIGKALAFASYDVPRKECILVLLKE